MQNSSASDPTPIQHRDSTLKKTPAELAKLKAKALAGDGEAAYEVFIHYGLGLRKQIEAEKWLRLAEKLGNPNAKKQLEQWQIADPSEYARFRRGNQLPTSKD